MRTKTKKTATGKMSELAQASQTFVLPATITIKNVEALTVQAGQLKLRPGETYVIDVSQIEVMTTPGVQLIIALAKTIENMGSTPVITKPTENVQQIFTALGLGSRLKTWEKHNG